jgi:2-polyprenyl-3-methyl-5-hydroxy-6-metoxy-1,4-benzoquinol methylase
MGETLVRTNLAEIGRWPKFHGPHYRLEELAISANTEFSIRWCGSCGLGFADPLLDQSHLSRLYNAVIVKAHARSNYAKSLESRRRQVRLILNLLDCCSPKFKPRHLLDFGAGWGLLLHEARTRGWEPHAIEFAEEERASLEADQFRVYSCLEEAPNDFFDAVGSMQVLEHIAEFQAITRTHAKKLRAGGLLYIDVPNAGFFARRHFSRAANPLEHVNYFTHRFLTRWLEHRSGFELVWPRLLAGPKESWRALRQTFGLTPLTVVFRKC